MSCQCFPPLSLLDLSRLVEIFEVKNKQPGHYWILFRGAWIEEALKTHRKATLLLLCLLMFTASHCLSCARYLELIAFSKSVCVHLVCLECAWEYTCVRLIVSVHIFPRAFVVGFSRTKVGAKKLRSLVCGKVRKWNICHWFPALSSSLRRAILRTEIWKSGISFRGTYLWMKSEPLNSSLKGLESLDQRDLECDNSSNPSHL